MLLLYKAMQVTLCERILSAAPRLVSSSKVHKERTRSSSDLLSKHIVENKMKKKPNPTIFQEEILEEKISKMSYL